MTGAVSQNGLLHFRWQLRMTTTSLTTTQVAVRIVAIVTLVEFLIMLAMGVVGFKANIYVEAIADILLLAALSTPLIFLLVITPFVKARDEALAQLSYLANTDPLTNLLNRRSIHIQLNKFIANAVRHQFYGAVLLLDLDDFKNINDAYGHDAGDRALVEIADRLRSRVRLDEVVGRWGGDEFILLINNLDTNEHAARNAAFQVAEQLVALLGAPITLDDTKSSIGVSIGIRIFGFDGHGAESAIRDADLAMYRAKESAKLDCVVFGE
jgi:two-component system, cell cycle response regulator